MKHVSDEDRNENTEEEQKSTKMNFNQVIVHNYIGILQVDVTHCCTGTGHTAIL